MRASLRFAALFAAALMVCGTAWAQVGLPDNSLSRVAQPAAPAPGPDLPTDVNLFENFEPNPGGLPVTPVPHGPPGATLTLGSGPWFVINKSSPIGTTGAFQGNSSVFPAQAGTAVSYAAMNFNSGSGLANISTWLMTPNLTKLQNGDTFKFWTRTVDAPAFPDRLRLRLSLAGASTNTGAGTNDVGDFTTQLLSVNETLTVAGYPSVWTQFSVTLSGLPAGPNSGRIAFNYNMPNAGPSGANSDFIGIDTVEYTQVPEPATLGLIGIAGVALLRRRSA
jgi:hypothetical protein